MEPFAETSVVPLKSSPLRAFQSVFESPNWGLNVLWLTIAALTQGMVVGAIGLLGWGSDLFRARSGLPGNPVPDIQPNRLGDYLSRGIWPFLVAFVFQLVAGMVFAIAIGFCVAIVAVLIAAIGEEAAGILFPIVLIPISLVGVMMLYVFSAPFLIRGMICQDFAKSFDFGWAREFVRIMFWEMIVSAILFWFLSMATLLAGFLICFIGYVPAMGVINGASMHLLSQWYEVFLSRGGTPVPIKPTDDEIIEAAILTD